MARVYLNIQNKRTARAEFGAVSPAQIAEHLKIDLVEGDSVTEEDAKLEALSQAVTEWVEDQYGVDILKCTRTQTQDGIKGGELHMIYGPVIAFTSVEHWLEGATAYTAFSSSLWQSSDNRVWSTSWPVLRSRAGVRVSYTSGLVNFMQAGGDPTPEEIAAARALVPSKVREAILNCIGHLFENREGQSVPNKYEAQAKLTSSGAPPNTEMLLTGFANMSLTGKARQ